MPGDLTISFIAGILITGVGGYWFLNKTCKRKDSKARWPFKIPRGQRRFQIWSFLSLLFAFNLCFTMFVDDYVDMLLPTSSIVLSTILTIILLIILNVLFFLIGYRAIGDPW
jgi:hypothetical protein